MFYDIEMSILTQPKTKQLYVDLQTVIDYYDVYKGGAIDPVINLTKIMIVEKLNEVVNALYQEIKKNPHIIEIYEDEIMTLVTFFGTKSVVDIEDYHTFAKIVGRYLVLYFLNKRIKIGMKPFDMMKQDVRNEYMYEDLICLVLNLYEDCNVFNRGKLTKAASK